MLESRTITTAYGDASIKGQLVQGYPQGGILSPQLWWFVIDDLLEELSNEGFLTHGYADDVAIIVRDEFLTVLRDRLCFALKLSPKDNVAGPGCL